MVAFTQLLPVTGASKQLGSSAAGQHACSRVHYCLLMLVMDRLLGAVGTT